MVDPGAVDRLFVAVGEYNEQFSLGGMLGGVLAARFDEEVSDGANGSPTDFKSTRITQQFFMEGAHKQTLNNLGLSLEPVQGKVGALDNLDGKKVQDSQLRMNVVDHGKFVGFLEGLKPIQTTEDTALGGHLKALAGMLSQQVLDNYDFSGNKASDEVLQLFGGLDGIIHEYRRLGMGGAVERLSAFLEHGRTGDLLEYVSVVQQGLLPEQAKFFGPAKWQGDASPEALENLWQNALSTLRMCVKNPKARALAIQLRGYLTACIATAIVDEEALKQYKPDHADRLREILQAIPEQLEAIEIEP